MQHHEGTLSVVLTATSYLLNSVDWSFMDVELITPTMHFLQGGAALIAILLGLIALYREFKKFIKS